MSKSDRELLTELKAVLTGQQYSPVVVGNYCAYARGFLDHLARRNILVVDVTEAQVPRPRRVAVGSPRGTRYVLGRCHPSLGRNHHVLDLFGYVKAGCGTFRRLTRFSVPLRLKPQDDEAP